MTQPHPPAGSAALLGVLGPRSRASAALARVVDPASIPAHIGGLSCHDAAALLARDDQRMAIRLLAGWLSTREAVWWACLCLEQILKWGGDIGSPALLTRVAQWVNLQDPAIANELAAAALGQKPVDMLAAAVSLTRDNISPDVKHPVAPKPGLAHRMTALAILGASSPIPESYRQPCLHHLIELGLDVAECLHPWVEKAIPYHPGLRSESARAVLATTGNIWENWK